jgi:hypothetical protein
MQSTKKYHLIVHIAALISPGLGLQKQTRTPKIIQPPTPICPMGLDIYLKDSEMNILLRLTLGRPILKKISGLFESKFICVLWL